MCSDVRNFVKSLLTKCFTGNNEQAHRVWPFAVTGTPVHTKYVGFDPAVSGGRVTVTIT
jgi:hypothetical protein